VEIAQGEIWNSWRGTNRSFHFPSSAFFFVFLSPNEADEGPLIDYVATLLTHDKSMEELKEYCVSNLTDFFDQGNSISLPSQAECSLDANPSVCL